MMQLDGLFYAELHLCFQSKKGEEIELRLPFLIPSSYNVGLNNRRQIEIWVYGKGFKAEDPTVEQRLNLLLALAGDAVMDAHNVDNNSSRKNRTSKRLETLERKKIVDRRIKAASALKDPLDSFPEFQNYNQQGLCFRLEAGHGAKLSRSLKNDVQKLLKLNMEKHYGVEWATEEKVKFREIAAPEARYIFVYEVLTSGGYNQETLEGEQRWHVVGFVHYRFTLEEELPVLYVYELQLEPSRQGKGLGKFLMQLIERTARKTCMAAIVLTVQKRNLSAMFFYTSKLGFCVSATSPSRVDLQIGGVNYEILCKALDEEAKIKLE